MKIKRYHFLLLAILAVFISSCNDDDRVEYSNNPTVITLTTSEIQSAPGQQITISAQLVDDFGIKYVDLLSGGLLLNTRINISSAENIVSEKQLTYTYEIPNEVTGSEYEITMLVKNLTGQISQSVIKVMLN